LGQSHWWFRARRRILLSVVRQALPPGKETIVVEIGCGVGDNVAALSREYTCVGVDCSSQAIDFARSRYPDAQFVLGSAPADLGDLAPRASLFLMADVLEHIEDDRAFFAQWAAAAPPGASFLVTVPADPSLWSSHDEVHGHFRRYDLATLSAVWRGLPLSPLLLSHFNSRLFPIAKRVRTRNRRRGASHGARGADLRLPAPWINSLLESVMFGESNRLLGALQGRRRIYSRGLSLMALLRKNDGAGPATRIPAVQGAHADGKTTPVAC
jgi:SAM-dependent methyltransferase